MKRLKLVLTVLAVCLCIFSFSVPAAMAASSNPLDQACSQGTASNSSLCQQAQNQGTTNPVSGPSGVINKAANIIALVAGIGAVIMILIGGLFYVTSAGNAESAAKAKSRILSAFIGLVVVALAWTIARLITDHVIK